MIIKQPLSNLKLSMLGADISTGGDYAYGVLGARISIGDTLRNVNRGSFLPVAGMADNGYSSRLSGYYNGSNISFSSILGSGQTSDWRNVVYFKTTPYDSGQWRSDFSPYYTSNSSASGALIAGTNGDLSGAFLGFDTKYNSYWMWGGASKHWRIGVNIYRLSADGTEFQRVYTHHHLVDSISDQSSISLGLSNFAPSDVKYTGTIHRDQADGVPKLSIGGYSIGANTVNGNSWMAKHALNGVNAWGQPLDAIDLEEIGNGYKTGIMLWQRQWWGPRLVAFSHNGSSIVHQSMQALDVFYQSWICDHNFGGQGGVAYSPITKKVCALFTYEPNGTTWGRNLAINSVTLNGANTNYPSFEGAVDTHLIHFIWGGGDWCRSDLGQYSGGAIEWLGYEGNMESDVFAYAVLNVSNGRVYIRCATRNWNEPSNNRCSWPEIGEKYYTGVNFVQRVRISRLNTFTDENGWLAGHFAFSYVNSSNQTVVKIFRWSQHEFTEIASYIPNNRGLLARNGTPNDGEPYSPGGGQHAIVVGTTNDGLQDTYIWGGKGDYLSRSGDQDLTRAIKLV